MQREAFSLIEMINGILIDGVLSAMGLQTMSDNAVSTADSADFSWRRLAYVDAIPLIACHSFLCDPVPSSFLVSQIRVAMKRVQQFVRRCAFTMPLRKEKVVVFPD